MIGISVYLNDVDYSYLEMAVDNGVKEIFTSFKMIEEDYQRLLPSAKDLIEYCNQNQLTLIADVDEQSACRFGLKTIYEFKTIGLTNIRIDGGLSNHEIAGLSQDFTVYLNASDIKEVDIEEQIKSGLNVNKCVAMHNFYPLESTGLSLEYFIQTNTMIRSYGIQVLAFIAGNEKLRGPVFNGLPTLERDRGSRPLVAYLQMAELVDRVFIGDNQICKEELELINNIDTIELRVKFYEECDIYDKELIIRPDYNDTLIRITDRKMLKADTAGYIYQQSIGAIIIQNTNAISRYQGEIQIIKGTLPSDGKKTVIGYVDTADIPLLKLIKPIHKIKFRNAND